jgi:hypothetical protein
MLRIGAENQFPMRQGGRFQVDLGALIRLLPTRTFNLQVLPVLNLSSRFFLR